MKINEWFPFNAVSQSRVYCILHFWIVQVDFGVTFWCMYTKSSRLFCHLTDLNNSQKAWKENQTNVFAVVADNTHSDALASRHISQNTYWQEMHLTCGQTTVPIVRCVECFNTIRNVKSQPKKSTQHHYYLLRHIAKYAVKFKWIF